MSDLIDDARQLIESRLAEIEAEASRLERAVASLGEGGGDRRPGPGRPRKGVAVATPTPSKPKRRAAPKRKAGKRAARGQRREELLAAIQATPGARPSELAKAIGIRPTQVSVLIAKARAEKRIVKTGDGYELEA